MVEFANLEDKYLVTEKYDLRRAKYQKELFDFRNKYIDDLPAEKVHMSDPKYDLYKCRGNFFQGVLATLENISESGVFTTPELQNQVEQSMQWIESLDYSVFRTKEDIAKVNHILEYLIEELAKNGN